MGGAKYCSQMLKTMTRIMNAFIMGKSDEVIAVIIFVSAGTRPKSLTILKARINRTSHPGIFRAGPPRSTIDITTMTRSSMLHPFLKNFSSQFANRLIHNSTANKTVKIKLISWTNESKTWLLLSFKCASSTTCLYCASRIQTTKFCRRLISLLGTAGLTYQHTIK